MKSIYYENKNKDDLYINIFDIKKFIVNGIIFPIEDFLFILSMIQKKFCVNEATFLLTRNYLYHNIYHELYNINPEINVIKYEKIEDKNIEDNNKDKNGINGITYISLLNKDIGDGMNNFESVIESTENAGKEINESFIQINQNLEQYSNRLHNTFNNDQ